MKTFARIFLFVSLSFSSAADDNWPDNDRVAVSLSYDDALGSQLDNAVPQLNQYHFKGSFYLTLSSPVVPQRLDEWRSAAEHGHELGNHTISHACRADIPDREWVAPQNDLAKRSVVQMVDEVKLANDYLYAIDGKKSRTMMLPCDESQAKDGDYLPQVKDQFVAIKGFEAASLNAIMHMPAELSGAELIAYLQSAKNQQRKLVNIIFHGVGGDYLTISNDAHKELLNFLDQHRDDYWVDSYINIMQQLANH